MVGFLFSAREIEKHEGEKMKKRVSNKTQKKSVKPIGVVGRPLAAAYQLEIAVRVLQGGNASEEVLTVANNIVLGYLSIV
jgi:hypothetical protein